MKIEGLRKYQRRNREGSYSEDLPPDVRARAYEWLKQLVAKRLAIQHRAVPHLRLAGTSMT